MNCETTVSSIDNDRVKELFIKYDINKNGVIEKDELVLILKDILRKLGENYPDKRNIEIAEECLEKFDANNNGIIEYSEFYEIMEFLVFEKGYNLQ